MEQKIADVIREHGWFAANIYNGDPPFLYTIGLMQSWNHPELILFGLEAKIAHGILANMVHFIRSGASYETPGSYSGILEGDLPLGLRRVDPTQHPLYLGFAMSYMTFIDRMGELEAMQVFLPDNAGKFPYDAGCDLEVYRSQPRLDVALTPSEIEEFEREWGD